MNRRYCSLKDDPTARKKAENIKTQSAGSIQDKISEQTKCTGMDGGGCSACNSVGVKTAYSA